MSSAPLTKSLRSQISLLLLLVFVFISATGLILVWVNLENRFLALEARETENHLERVAEVISDQIAAQSLQLADWADWDDALAFVTGKQEPFRKVNLVPAVLEGMQLSAIRIYKLDKTLFGAISLYPEDKEHIESHWEDLIKSQAKLFPDPNSDEKVSGVVQLGDRPYAIAIKGIRGTLGKGSAAGYMVFMKHMGDEFTQKVSALTRQNLSRASMLSSQAFSDDKPQQQIFEFLHLSNIAYVTYDWSHENFIRSQIIVQDLFKSPVLSFQFDVPREILAQGRSSMQDLSSLILVLVPVMVLSIAMMLHRWVTRPLEQLTSEISRIDLENHNKTPQVSVNASNEIGSLARQMNAMLSNLHSKNHQLWLQSRDIRMILDHTKIGILSVTPDMRIHPDYSRQMAYILAEEDLALRSFETVFLDKIKLGQDQKDRIRSALEFSMGEKLMIFTANSSNLPSEAEIEAQAGVKTIVDLDWSAILDEQDCVERVLLSVRDVTETLALRKEAEANLQNRNFLLQIIEAGPSNYQKLAKSVRKFLTLMQSQSHWPPDLHRQAHNLKSSARLRHLPEISNQLHCLETLLEAHRQDSLVPGALNHEIQQTVELLDAYDQSMVPLLQIDFISSLSVEPPQTVKPELICVKDLWKRLQHYADHLAKDLGKGGYRFVLVRKGKLEVRRETLEVLEQSFLHLINNSIDHGLESPAIRLQKGKPNYGQLFVDFHPESGKITITDDGSGIDIAKVRSRLGDHAQPIQSPDQLVKMLFIDGFSTADSVTQISGRGWGLASVQQDLLNQGIEISLEPRYDECESLFVPFRIHLLLPKASYQWSPLSTNS